MTKSLTTSVCYSKIQPAHSVLSIKILLLFSERPDKQGGAPYWRHLLRFFLLGGNSWRQKKKCIFFNETNTFSSSKTSSWYYSNIWFPYYVLLPIHFHLETSGFWQKPVPDILPTGKSCLRQRSVTEQTRKNEEGRWTDWQLMSWNRACATSLLSQSNLLPDCGRYCRLLVMGQGDRCHLKRGLFFCFTIWSITVDGGCSREEFLVLVLTSHPYHKEHFIQRHEPGVWGRERSLPVSFCILEP